MSTIDPDAASRRKAAITPTLRDLFWPIAVSILLPLAAGFFMTRMLANAIAFDVFDVFSVIALVLTFPGLGALVVTMIQWYGISSRNENLPDISLGIGLAVVGATLGHTISAPAPGWVQAPRLDWTAVIGILLGIFVIVFGEVIEVRDMNLSSRTC